MEIQRQDLQEERGFPWPLCSITLQAEFSSSADVRFTFAIKRLRIAVK